jgi:hypothetical protein
MARHIYRYAVPVDDKPHEVALTGDPLAVAVSGSRHDFVEFWAENDDEAETRSRWFQVVGTGHPLPEGVSWAGTCPRVSGIVLHLCEVPPVLRGSVAAAVAEGMRKR